ncbi:MAG: mandelate racemase/muconate lactonizing enzyme family protein [Acidiferrobacterales bacterium]|nr:mandelate racemase/muconate lactonizing enzyme family protein [Acidiferrobacterales bacterium]
MLIKDIQITRHELEIKPPFPSSWDPRPLKTWQTTIVRVMADNGMVGIASGDAMIGFERYKDLFVGEDAFDFDRHNRILDSISLFASRCWPLDLALWDLYGKAKDKPVYELLGGDSGVVPLYASTGTVRPPNELAEQACRIRDMGFKAIKFRVGRRALDEDVEALRAVRKALGDGIEIMIDANQAWRMPWDTSDWWTYDDARLMIDKTRELNLYWLEEPLHRGDFEGLRKLRSISDGPRIASGEMNTEYYELRYLMSSGCLDVLQTDCVYFGGITGLAAVAKQSKALGVTFSPHTWGNGIGLLANAHLAAGTGAPPYLEYAIDPPEWTLEERDFMLTGPVMHDGNGSLDLGTRPGLGIELDEDILNSTRIR